MPQGSTPQGSAWLAKTLHPADVNPPWAGIPDGSGEPSVVMEYEAILRIAPQAAAVGTWASYVNVLSDPVQPLSASVFDSAGDTNFGLRNPTLYTTSTDTMAMCVARLAALCHAWRMTHQSVTIELDAPALSNQGTVVAAQIPTYKVVQNPSWILQAGADTGKLAITSHVVAYDFEPNKPSVEQIASKPMAYSGLAKDGIYMVMRQDPDAEFVNTGCVHSIMAQNGGSLSVRGNALPTSSYANPYPYYGLNLPAAARTVGAFINPAAATSPILSGDYVATMQQPVHGTIGFLNLSVNAALVVRVRWGVEMLVQANSPLAPTMKACAPRDDLALAVYSRIVDELPDAYPASYNSWDDLTKVLKTIWRNVSTPLKGIMGGVMATNPVAGMIGQGLVNFGDVLAADKAARITERKPEVVPREPQYIIQVPSGKQRQKQKQKKAARSGAKLSKAERSAIARANALIKDK